MQVTQTQDGKWQLIAQDGAVISTYPTNAEAWRAYDRYAGEPVNRREQMVNDFWRKDIARL